MATTSSNSYGLCFCILFSCAASKIIHDQRHLLTPIADTYTPTTDIDNEAILDLDLQLIYARTLSGTEDSLQEAASVYSNGDKSTISIESMGTSTVNPNVFYAYSGAYDYEDRLMKAALAGDSTDFPNGADTNFDFSVFGKVGRAEFVRYGALGSVYNQIITELRGANEKCSNETDVAHNHLDRAVAFYTGSMSRDGGPGQLLYTLAEVESQRFGTYDSISGMSKVNKSVLSEFNAGKSYLNEKKCNLFVGRSDVLESLMLVPFIQALLGHTYALDNQGDSAEKTQGEVAGIAASLLPYLRLYNDAAAVVVHRDLSPGKATGASFEVVKYNLERTYKHLGISCADVGGLRDYSGTSYLRNAMPCGYVAPSVPIGPTPSTSGNGDNDTSLIVGLVFGGICVLIIVAYVARKTEAGQLIPSKIKKNVDMKVNGDLEL
eukprot:CAMPEP_0116021924 /NCGR_PEP_ID=MMETSP0321-20121206/10680_1 /TAXON_ID=163516 /ORGANISM="Leptocylindrus danicus var. danicus, Strain B650" /LENGTH=434 /DNA_ID=CAMNT_0003492895 /DNA_START=21 /DNA_END=1322 /DNA_ORIENTATION=+